MSRQIWVDDDDSDFSETDMSIRGRKGTAASFHRRSISRRRPSPRENLYLSPVRETKVFRSASTGGRRPREPREPRETPTVMIVNEQAQRANNDNANSNKPRRVQQRVFEHESDEEPAFTPRRRAASGVKGASRTPSPFHRDYEMMINQRLLDHDQRRLEKSDFRQDMEIRKQQQEIERLERELEKHRERSEHHEHTERHDSRELRILRQEEEWYEDEISDRLRRLERFEGKARDEEQQRKAEHRWRLRKFEEAEKEAAEKEEVKAKLHQEKLAAIAREQEEREERDKLRREFAEEEARKAREAEEKRKKEALMKAAAVEEWKLEQERIKQKQKEEAEKKDREFRERLVMLGYSEDEIEHILNKKKWEEDKEKAKKEKEEKEKKEKEEKEKKELEERETKTTWIKVHRKHLMPETLIAYGLPWEWDERDSSYIIIKRWVTEDFQEELFGHTRRLREGKVLTQTSASTTELRVKDRNKDKMFLVRKKSPSRRTRIFA
ncbi:hypothetical protein N7492_001260 [Penicillium capsulatum]|uniref:Uncharacterized protein n=1 Tax=Penicillium capsulatum TaxID=69766 RepID=A0A9W9IR97_9EURO|nr:hypothetical protein N7492_001260 [Penicillium capsulatum]KAJ6129682.1 hypothetical protein N7512_002462 [Penicillium capsulatum]